MGDSAMATPTRRAVPRRAAATKATSNFTEQLASSSPIRQPDAEQSGASGPLGSDSELSELTDDEGMDLTPTKTPPLTVKSSGRSPTKKFDELSPMRSPKVKRTYARKDRAMLPDTQTSALPAASSSRLPQSPASPLTPISSPLRSPSKSSRVKTSNKQSTFDSPLSALPRTPSKRKRRTTNNAEEGDDVSPTHGSPSKRRNVKNAGTKPSPQPFANGKSLIFTGTKKEWSLDTLGHTVWVKVTDRNELASDGMDNQLFWWPAKVTKPLKGSYVKVSLLNPPNPVASALLEIRDPSHANVRSHYDPTGNERFNATSFREGPASNLAVSGSKGLDYDARWRVALEQMHSEEDNLNEFPDSLADLLSQSTASKYEEPLLGSVDEPEAAEERTSSKSNTRKGKAKAKPVMKSKKEIFKEQWTDLPDGTLEIPGELVLSLEKKRTTVYWPGTVMEFQPPVDETKVGKYLVKLFDGMEVLVTRQMFLTTEQDEFAVCKLGELRPLPPPSEDDDQDAKRALSPEPYELARSTRDFHNLTIRQQFSYIKPILLCILNDNYPPAKEVHDAFMAGGAKRVEVCRKLGAKGTLRNDEYEALSACVQRWALGGDERARHIDDGRVQEDSKIAMELPDPKMNGAKTATTNEFSTPQPIRSDPITHTEPPGIEPLLNGGNDHAAENTLYRPPPSSSVATPPGTPRPVEEPMSNETENDAFISADGGLAGDHSPDLSLKPEDSVLTQSTEIARMNTRLHGCAAYERLSPAERIDYCMSILLQEAVYQILIWRADEREDTQRLSDEEEERLRSIGFAKATEVNAWTTVLHLREMKRKELGLPSETKPVPVQGNPFENISRTRRRNA